MSGFEVAGVVLGIIPLLDEGLKFYKHRSKEIIHHEESMNQLIATLHYQHIRFRSSCERLLDGLVKGSELKALLDEPSEKGWLEALNGGLETRLRQRLGHDLYFFSSTIRSLVSNFAVLNGILGLQETQRWYSTTKYSRRKWHKETWKTIKDCLQHDRHSKVLAAIEAGNSRLETVLPSVVEIESTVRRAQKADISRWESLLLEDRAGTPEGSERFRMAFSVQYDQSTTATDAMSWTEVIATPKEEDDDSENLRAASRVRFGTANTPDVILSDLPMVNQQITGLCNILMHTTNNQDSRCLGFIPEAKHKHYIHLIPSLSAPCQRNAVSLFQLLQSHGRISSPVPLGIELLDKYELAVLLASSLLQLHATSWLDNLWSTKDIHFIPSAPDMLLRDCAFIARNFPQQSQAPLRERSSTSVRKLVIQNEAIVALGITLIELSVMATLDSKETESDRAIPDLVDLQTARRLAETIKRNNVREWNNVIDICLRCSFHVKPDFEKKEFRQEYYECVVAPLQKLYDDAKAVP
ncbi:hypothetical protein MBLNU459_g5815t1 [Dothideomycetes sp. NU459]